MSVRAGRCAVLAPGDEPMRAPGPKRVRGGVGARRFHRRSVEKGRSAPPRAQPARAPRRHPNMAAAFIARGFAITASLAGARRPRAAPTSLPPAASSSTRTADASRWLPRARAHRAFAASADADRIAELVEKKIAENKVMVWSKSYCPFCSRVKTLLDDAGCRTRWWSSTACTRRRRSRRARRRDRTANRPQRLHRWRARRRVRRHVRPQRQRKARRAPRGGRREVMSVCAVAA